MKATIIFGVTAALDIDIQEDEDCELSYKELAEAWFSDHYYGDVSVEISEKEIEIESIEIHD